MKKFESLLIIIITIMTTMIMTKLTYAKEGNKGVIILKVGSPIMTVDGVKKEIEPGKNTSPKLVNGYVLSPIQTIVEAMGGSANYNTAEKRIDITMSNNSIQLWLNKKTYKLNGKILNLAITPQVIGGRPMFPIKYVAEKLLATVVYNSKTKETTISYIKQSITKTPSKEILVINDEAFKNTEYVIKEKDNGTYIFLPLDRFKYCLKYPMLGNESIFPEVHEKDGNISFSWKMSEDNLLEINMSVGNSEASISGQTVDIVMSPYRDSVNDKIMIPINLFVEVLKMEITTDKDTGLTFIHYKDAFPKEYLIGTWSDTHTDLFTGFQDLATGAVGLSSFAQSFVFNPDGTYRLIMISSGGFVDTLIQQHGKYKVIGFTIVYYDISETLYKGNPFKLIYKDKLLEYEEFNFIDNYENDSTEGKIRIEIDLNWENKIK